MANKCGDTFELHIRNYKGGNPRLVIIVGEREADNMNSDYLQVIPDTCESSEPETVPESVRMSSTVIPQ